MRRPIKLLKVHCYNYSTRSTNATTITTPAFSDKKGSRLYNLVRKSNNREGTMVKFPRSMSSSSTKKTASASDSNGSALPIPPPTQDQVRIFAIANALPMVGFGFTDQTVMIQAGNAIDCSIGVTFGLSTLTAAAVGQVCSNAAGILFGGTIGNLAKSAGLPSSNLTSLQRTLPVIKQTRVAAQLAGVLLGCTLGLANLLLIDTERSSSLKLKNMDRAGGGSGSESPGFEIEASNDKRKDATTFVVRGPDFDGLLANFTDVLSANGCSLLQLSAGKIESGGVEGSITGDASVSNQNDIVEDVFVVVNQNTKEQLSNIEMEAIAQILMETSKLRHNDHRVRVKDLEERNASFTRQIQMLEEKLAFLQREEK